jgi:hypothetical protein
MFNAQKRVFSPYLCRLFPQYPSKGNYGAGTMMVWDQGIYEPLEKEAGKKTGMVQIFHILSQNDLSQTKQHVLRTVSQHSSWWTGLCSEL